MPFTPFHFGPALLTGLLFVRWLDFPTFLVASVLVDIRAIAVFFGLLDGPLHGPFHTLLGATVLAGILTVVALPLRPLLDPVLDWFGIPQSVSRVRIVAAALIGCWVHILLDAVLYADLQPFEPVSATNPMLGMVGFDTVYGGCTVAGLLGFGLYIVLARRNEVAPAANTT